MPKSKHRKPKQNSIRSPIESHKRSGKKLVPPFIDALGDKLEFTSWMNDRLPEMLWAALIFASMERRQAFNECMRILKFVAEHERKKELSNLTISRIAELEGGLKGEFISFITTNPRTSLSLSPLMLFDSLPGREDWETHLPDPQPSSRHLLMTAVGDTLFQQSTGATDCRWVWFKRHGGSKADEREQGPLGLCRKDSQLSQLRAGSTGGGNGTHKRNANGHRVEPRLEMGKKLLAGSMGDEPMYAIENP